MHLFTAVHSSVATLVSKLAPRPTPNSTTRANSARLRNPKSHKGVVRRPQAIRARHAILGQVEDMGLRVLEKTKRLWTKPAQRDTTPARTVHEAPGIPHTVVIETLETRSGFVQPRTRVYTYWDVDPDTPGTTLDELGRESEADATTSVFLEDSDVDQYLNEILDEIAEGENEWRSEYEWGDSDTEYEAIPDSATSGIALSDAGDDGHALSHFEVENEGEVGTSSPSNQWHSPTGAAPSPISIFFCPPTSSSTLVPSMTFEDLSALSTPRYNPVVVHESESYEEALYSDFKKLIGEA